MYLGYQQDKIKYYVEQPLNSSIYNVDRWEETQDEYALDGDEYVIKDEAWEEEQKRKERERINMLMLTGADVERAIYKNCGMDFEDVVALLETKYADVIDVKAVKIELKANNFYRGNPYVVQIGTLLGYSSDDMDYLFEHKELPTKEDEGTVKDDLTVGEPNAN